MRRLSCSVARGIFPDQGLNPYLLEGCDMTRNRGCELSGWAATCLSGGTIQPTQVLMVTEPMRRAHGGPRPAAAWGFQPPHPPPLSLLQTRGPGTVGELPPKQAQKGGLVWYKVSRQNNSINPAQVCFTLEAKLFAWLVFSL